MSEINPQHPVTRTMHDNWHKVVAILLHKYRDRLPSKIVITAEDIQALDSIYPGSQAAVALRDTGKELVLQLVSYAEAERLARQQHG